eukprot:8488349-Karenia_brevis.AAC.1
MIRQIRTEQTLFTRSWKEHERYLYPQGFVPGSDDFAQIATKVKHPADWSPATGCLRCETPTMQRFVCCPRGLCEEHMGIDVTVCPSCRGV